MSRPVYTTLAQVKAKLPLAFITEALDDDADGVIDEDVWTQVTEDAADQVDARLGKRYAVPFNPENLEAIVSDASKLFVLETLYLRRGFGTEENNPFKKSADTMRNELRDIGNGKGQLTPEAVRPKKSVAVFTEPAKTTSSAGNLSS